MALLSAEGREVWPAMLLPLDWCWYFAVDWVPALGGEKIWVFYPPWGAFRLLSLSPAALARRKDRQGTGVVGVAGVQMIKEANRHRDSFVLGVISTQIYLGLERISPNTLAYTDRNPTNCSETGYFERVYLAS